MLDPLPTLLLVVLLGQAQHAGLGWGGFPMGALGAGAYFGFPAAGQAPAAVAAARPHGGGLGPASGAAEDPDPRRLSRTSMTGAKMRCLQPGASLGNAEMHRVQSAATLAGPDLHRLQSGASKASAEMYRLQSGASLAGVDMHRLQSGGSMGGAELHRLQSGASSRAVGSGGPRVTFRGLPPSGPNALGNLGANDNADLMRMQSGASSRAGPGEDSPFPSRVRLAFRAQLAADAAAKGGLAATESGGGAQGQDADLMRMQSVTSGPSKATTEGTTGLLGSGSVRKVRR